MKFGFVLEIPYSVFLILESGWVVQVILISFILTRNKWKEPGMVSLSC